MKMLISLNADQDVYLFVDKSAKQNILLNK